MSGKKKEKDINIFSKASEMRQVLLRAGSDGLFDEHLSYHCNRYTVEGPTGFRTLVKNGDIKS